MKLDIHTHILPNKLPNLQERYGCPGWINIKQCDDDPSIANMYKDDQFFRRIEKIAGVWKKDAETCKPEHTNDLCHLLNDDIALQINEHQKKSTNNMNDIGSEKERTFYGFGTLPMQDPLLAVEEMTRCCKDLGFKGIQIGTHINDWNLDEKKLYPIWKRAEELDCPIFVHPWDMDHISRTSKYWLPWLVGMPAETTTAICCLIMGNVLTQFPKLKFCFAHGGGAFPFTIGRIQHGFNVRPDLCATDCSVSPQEFLGKFYTDSLVHSKESLDLLVNVIGEDKVILGSDYPFPLGELDTGTLIESSGYDQRLKEKLLFENGMRFLGVN